ncbi:MAG: WD40 repeat domain-containing protein [Thiomargarita sp.]|nr:WD40 repeat domain-containing protein [Thiomargarita sp.]
MLRLKINNLFKFSIIFVIFLALFACEEAKMRREGARAVTAFLVEMNPELAKKTDSIKKEISITQQKIKQLAKLKLKHPNYAEKIEKSQQKWIQLQNKLRNTLREIKDVVESAYVTYQLNKIQGGKQFNNISTQLLISANSVLDSANTTKNAIEETLYELDSTISTPSSANNLPIEIPQEPNQKIEIMDSQYDIKEIVSTINNKDSLPSINNSKSNIFPLQNNLPINLYKTLQGHNGDINALEFSPDGNTLASASDDNSIKLWEVSTGKELSTWRDYPGDDILTIAFSPNGQLLASSGNDQIISLWKISTGQKISTLVGHQGVIHSIDFSPNGRTLISGGWDETIRFWDIQSATQLRLIKEKDSVYSVAFSSDGRLIAVGSFNNTVTIWDVDTGELLHVLQGNGMQTVYSVAFSPDGKYVISGDLSNYVRAWDIYTGELKLMLKENKEVFGGVYSVTFSPNGQIIAAGSSDETIKLWDVKTKKLLFSLKEQKEVKSVVFSPNGNMLASGHDDNMIRLWITD